jgi:hypothetical protein
MSTRSDLVTRRSLAGGVAGTAPGALCALTVTGGITIPPQEGLVLRFGRNRPEVDICVGEDDLGVSRLHGTLSCRLHRWWVGVTGRQPARMRESVMLHRGGEPLPLPVGYTPLFLRGSRGRQHVVELYVAGDGGGRPPARPGEPTLEPRRWRLTPEEHLALVVLGQRYLLFDPHPRPLSRQQAAEQLDELRPDGKWTAKKVDYLVSGVRKRLSDSGVAGLSREEVGEPVGLALSVNLLGELVASTTLVPLDLSLLDQATEAW